MTTTSIHRLEAEDPVRGRAAGTRLTTPVLGKLATSLS